MYYQVVLAGGNLVTVYHDLIEDLWYLQQAGAPKRLADPVPVLIPERRVDAPAVADGRDAAKKNHVVA